MSIVQSIRKQFVPIHREGWPFVAGFAAGALVLGYIADPLGWIGWIHAWMLRISSAIRPARSCRSARGW
jgi:phosphatidylserine decarboxylase